ncbi:similar to RIKEN cDNA 4732496O08 (predicted), partial [Rattus norvegicus]
MSIYNPPTLEHLAMEALLWNDAIDFSDLEDLPTIFFPSLLKEAFSGRHTEILKAVVAAWPFPYLHVGSLLKTNDVEMMQAVLDGIDILLTQEVRPRRGKLQVLDLRDMHQDFRDVCARREYGGCSADKVYRKQVPVNLPSYEVRQHLKVITNLSLFFNLNEDQKCFLQWAQKRKDSLQLCCLKMKICVFPLEIIKEILNIFQPNYFEELEICTPEVLSFLHFFAYFLGQMRNLLKFHLNQIHFKDNVVDTVTEIKKYAGKFFSQFSELSHLQHLYMNGAYFANDNMKELSRCLKSSLDSLSITFCSLSMSDLKHMSRCQRLYQLKHLHFTSVVFSKSCFKSLHILLEHVSETLQSLQLEHCRMKDSQLKILLPALSKCSQLTSVNFYGNNFSSSVLKELLKCMANLNKLTVEYYPAPLECYDHLGHIVVERFSQLCPELMNILIAKRQPEIILFATATCPRCWKHCAYGTKTTLCLCWQ